MSRRMLGCLAWLLLVPRIATYADFVRQSARDIPVVHEVDVVIIGGTLGGVASAVEAADAGARVLLVAPRTYLGEDLCATLRLWREQDEAPRGSIAEKLFSGRRTTTPLLVKKTLESELLDAGVSFLLASYPTDMLVDAAGQPAGIVIANRAGRQAILAKVLIDATAMAVVADLAGAEREPWMQGEHRCTRVVLGGQPDSQVQPARTIAAGVSTRNEEPSYYEYDLPLNLADGGWAAIAEAEQQARDLTYRSDQFRAAERLTMVPPNPIRGRASAAVWTNVASARIGHFQPRGVTRIYVLSGASDVPRQVVAELLRPTAYERLGRRVGQAAAHEAAQIALLRGVRVLGSAAAVDDGGDVREVLAGLRPTDDPDKTVPAQTQGLPVLQEVDVLVVGGGTSGACAAIGAARRGAKVLVVEYQEGLGGVGTVGLIGHPYHGRNRGFTTEVPFCDAEHNNEYKMEWFRREIRRTGGKIWLGAIGCGAYVEGDRVRGAMVATTQGRGAVLADVVIDATGNADIAIAAGADSMYGGDAARIALQGTGLPLRPLGESYVNTDYLFVDESDMLDTWRALVGVRLASPAESYDMGALIQNRERRRVVGDHTLTYCDQVAGRTYPDSVVLSGSDYDSHGYPTDAYFALFPHTEKTRKANHPAPGGTCYTPYRCLLPRGLEGMLVIGLGISMHRDAAAMVRMQKDMHNQGYAAGVAAAMAAEAGRTPREIDVRALQRHLVQVGNLPETVLSDTDSFPVSQARLREAVGELARAGEDRDAACKALACVLAHQDEVLPLLHAAFAAGEDDQARLTYAKLLGFLGQAEAVPVLLAELDKVKAWDPKIFQGNMAEYAHLPTPVDSLILALGYPRDRRATPAILRKLDMLDAGVTLSHHRAVALALESLADPAAAAPLARLLDQPGMRGHAMTGLEPLYNRQREKRRREGPLREIVLARALYRCGDHEGLAERILTEYAGDIRGLFARHARAVLAVRSLRSSDFGSLRGSIVSKTPEVLSCESP